MTETSYLHRKPPALGDAPATTPEKPPEPPAPGAPPEPAPPAPAPTPEAPPAPAPTAPTPAATIASSPPVAKARRPRQPTPAPLHPMQPLHWALLAATTIVALALRMRDPISNAVIGAEDPYLHMERTWNLLQGDGVDDYPLGFMVLLAPFALLGPDVFYGVARFLPPFIGAGAIVATFFLCRPYLHPSGTLTTCLVLAIMPEHIIRTNLLFPTALDLALLPVILLGVLRWNEGVRWGLPTAGALSLLLLLVHPWVVVLMLPPLGIYWLILLLRRKETRNWAAVAGGATVAAFTGVLVLLPGSRWTSMIVDHAFPRFFELLTQPGSLFPLPQWVNYPSMFTWPILLLAAAGAVLAVMKRSRFGLLALLWTGFLLPFSLVDWFGVPFIPHRTAAYLGIGIALLAAYPVAELVLTVKAAKPTSHLPMTGGILAGVLLLTLLTGQGAAPWYRIYDEQDYQAWDALEARDTTYLVAGSWQARAGYRALTANAAVYNPSFFQDERIRAFEVDAHPGLVVLVDQHTTEAGLPTEFLQSWTLIGEWGDSKAYTPA